MEYPNEPKFDHNVVPLLSETHPDEIGDPSLCTALALMHVLAQTKPNWGTRCPTADQIIYLLRSYFNGDNKGVREWASEIEGTH